MSTNSYRDAARRNFEALRKLWRNFLYVWQNNAVLRSVMAQQDYQNMLRDSANKVASLPTDKVEFVPLTNRLAVLVAATAILS